VRLKPEIREFAYIYDEAVPGPGWVSGPHWIIPKGATAVGCVLPVFSESDPPSAVGAGAVPIRVSTEDVRTPARACAERPSSSSAGRRRWKRAHPPPRIVVIQA
jgi:hypothetical protein